MESCRGSSKAPPVVPSRAWFLERLDLYKHARPYMITFDTDGLGCEKTNHVYAQYTVDFHDARESLEDFRIQEHGFQFCRWPTSLEAEGFDDSSRTRTEYVPELLKHFRAAFPEFFHIEVVAIVRRKRRQKFMEPSTMEPEFNDPIIYAHADFTPLGVKIAMEETVKKHPDLAGRRIAMINVWRVTRGPNMDWPLALCDFRTVNPADVETNDVIHRGYVGESIRVHHDEKQKWYFLSQQMPDEVIVFQNADSSNTTAPFAAHMAFEHPDYLEPEHLRESIEVRLACFE